MYICFGFIKNTVIIEIFVFEKVLCGKRDNDYQFEILKLFFSLEKLY